MAFWCAVGSRNIRYIPQAVPRLIAGCGYYCGGVPRHFDLRTPSTFFLNPTKPTDMLVVAGAGAHLPGSTVRSDQGGMISCSASRFAVTECGVP
jgi:hypothetical protein